MNRAGIDVDHVSGMDVNPVQQVLGALLFDRALHLVTSRAWLQSQSNLRAGLGRQDVPALGFAAGLAEAPRTFIVGMNLHRELLPRKQELDEQRKPTFL